MKEKISNLTLTVDTLLYWLDRIQPSERFLVGDKAFYLSQQAQAGGAVIPGFAIAASALGEFLATHNWSEPLLTELLTSTLYVDVDNVCQLQGLAEHICQEICNAELPEAWMNTLEAAADRLPAQVLIFRPSLVQRVGSTTVNSAKSVIRCPQISGLLESRICTNDRESLARAWKETWAELFTARSLFYWQRSGIPLQHLDLAILVQPVEKAIAAGSLETEADVWLLKATWGLGMSISAGKTIPDSYQINPVTGKVEQKTLGNKLIAYSLAIGDSQDTSVFNVFEGAIADNQETNQAAESGLKPEVSTAANLDFCQCIQPMILTDEQQEQYALPEPYLSELVRLTKTLVAQLGDRLVLEWLICPATTPKSPEPSNSNSKIFPNATLYLTQVSPLDTTRKKQQLTHRSVARDRLPESTPESTPESSKHHPLLVGLGAAPGEAIAPAFVIRGDNKFIENIPPGSIIVSKTINVDTLFCLQKAAGVIAEQGGITSHAAILARELGIPAVVSAARATEKINPGQRLLINGDRGAIYHLIGQPASEKESSNARPELNQRHSIFRTDNPETIASKNIEKLTSTFPPIATQLLVNLSQPKSLKKIANLPVDGVGLLRSEMMILDILDRQPPQQWIEAGRQQEFVDLMSDRLVKIARYMFPRPVFYRSCDLRSDEYQTSEEETNPALGVHGAFSYLVDSSLFELELAVLERVQTDGHNNLHLILPFVRSVEEFIFCRQRVEQAGLNRVSGFQLWIMAEVPSVLFLLEDYIKAGVQGIAIGTNDLTQLLLGADRNHPQFQSIFDPRHPAVRKAICQLISTAKQAGIPCSICGHNPAMYPEVVDDLVRWGITGISVEPISFETTYRAIARSEQRLILEAARRKL